MPIINSQEFYLTEELVKDSYALSDGYQNNKPRTIIHNPISLGKLNP